MDAYHAFDRIQEIFEAESSPNELHRNGNLGNALELDNASFSWSAPPQGPERESESHSAGATASASSGSTPGSRVSDPQGPENPNGGFKIQKTSLEIPRGRVVAIVGPVGSGKSSLLQALIGEMRRESGSVRFGGSISYCPQTAWIQVSPLFNVFHATKQTVERHRP